MSAFGIAWLRGRFLCAADGRSWEAPEIVSSWDQLEAALREGAAQVGFRGRRACLLLDHAAFEHRMEPTPPLRDRARQEFLRRMIDREEGAEPRWWSAQRAAVGRGQSLVLLHAAPREWLEELVRIFSVRKLVLDRVVPLTSVLETALRAAAALDDLAVGAVEFGGWTTAVVARRGGELAFGRCFRANWRTERERLGVEINRSGMFAKQRCGASPSGVYLFGGGDAAVAAVKQRCAGLAKASAPAISIEEWLQDAASIPPGDPRNLLSVERKRRRRRAWIKGVAAAAAWAGLVLFGLNCWTQAGSARSERAHFRDFSRHAEVMRTEREQLLQRNRTVAAERALLAALEAQRLPAVPQRFLAYSAAIVPSDMRLTGLTVERTDQGWRFAATGSVAGSDDAARAELSSWQGRLAQPPWRVRFAATDPASDAGVPAHFQVEGGLLEN